MKPGKISENVLKRSVLKYIDYEKTEIARGAGIGNDCALFAFGQGCATASCSLQINHEDKLCHTVYAALNNLATEGKKAEYIMLSITLPERAREIKLKEIMQKARELAKKEGFHIAGGHTEVSSHVSEIVVSVTAFSKPEDRKKENKPKENIVDYDIVLCGYIGAEAGGILATHKEELSERFPGWMIDQLEEYREHLSVTEAAGLAIEYGAYALHDIGEGGLFSSLWEMAQRLGTGLEIEFKKIPMRQSVIEVCNFYDLNPYEILSQGCLLVVIKDGEGLVSALQDKDIPGAVIGKVTDKNDRIIQNGEEIRYMDLPKPDQIRKIF